MKQFLLITCIAFGLSGFAQDMKPYKVDENLSVDLPEDATEVDTMGQTIITAYSDYGFIMVAKIENAATHLPTEERLKQFYAGFRNGEIERTDGKLISAKIIQRNGLIWESFSFFMHQHGEDQIGYAETVILKGKVYIVQVLMLKENADRYKDEHKKLLASIRTNANLTLKDQLTVSDPDSEYEGDPAYEFGKLLGYLLIIGIIVLVVYLSRQQKKKNQL